MKIAEYVFAGLQALAGIASAQPATLTLPEALQLAEERNSTLVAARAAVTAAEGQASDARAFLWNNPQASAERLERRGSDTNLDGGRVREWSAGISQTLEIAGQQRFRRLATEDELTAARLQLTEATLALRAEAERRFVRALALQLRLASERENLALLDRMAGFARRRLEAGEDNKLESNVARIEAGRSRSQAAAVDDQLAVARMELGEAIQYPGGLPELAGSLDSDPPSMPLAQMLERSSSNPRVAALVARESASRHKLSLERAARVPDVTLGASIAREGPYEAREKVFGINVSVPLPLFRRNGANIAQASADVSKAQAELETARRDTQASIRSTWERAQALRARIASLRDEVLPALEENRRLSQRALAEGEIAITQLVMMNRQYLEGQRELLEAQTELRLLHIALTQFAAVSRTP